MKNKSTSYRKVSSEIAKSLFAANTPFGMKKVPNKKAAYKRTAKHKNKLGE